MALVGGILGIAFHLISYSLLGTLEILSGENYSSGPFARVFTTSLILCAISLSALGLFGLYGALVTRLGRPGKLAVVGAAFAAVSAVLWLATSGYAAVAELASGSALFAPFEWLWYTGIYVLEVATLSWFLGLLLLGIAAVRERLPILLRVIPLALFALILPSYVLGSYFETVGGPVTAVIVMGFAQSLPFVGIALLGWVLLKTHDAESLVVSGGPVKSAGGIRETTSFVSRTAGGIRGRRPGMSGVEEAREKEVLEAIQRHGEITAAKAALETSLSVDDADKTLSKLAGAGHLEVRVEEGRILYSLWESDR